MAQLQDDLIVIRQQLKLSADDIHDKTRLSTLIIRQIEDGSIFESDQNKTYIRSFVRTYARALNIRDEDMIEALNQLDEGRYDDYLRKKYAPGVEKPVASETGKSGKAAAKAEAAEAAKSADSDKNAPVSASATGSASVKTPAAEAKGSKQEQEQEPEPVAPPKTEKKEAAPPPPPSQIRRGAAAGRLNSGKKASQPAQPSRMATPAPAGGPRASEVNWSNLSQGASRRSSAPVSAIIIIALVLIAVGASAYWYLNSEDGFSGLFENLFGTSTEETVRESRVTDRTPELLLSDTLDAPVAPDPALAIAATQVLPDTLSIVVYAATGNLEPFRVRADTFENRRPYWVEQGRGMRIKFINEVAVSGNFNRMLVLYDDRLITTFAETNDQGERIIRRSQFEQDPTLRSFTATQLPQGVSAPREIIDRPLF